MSDRDHLPASRPGYYPFTSHPIPPSQRVPSSSFPVPTPGQPPSHSQISLSNPNGRPIILPPVPNESKRDRKRRETINKVEMLHDESFRGRDEKFSALYRDFHKENEQVNSQPPTSVQYDLKMYPKSVERDALFEATEVNYQYKMAQAAKAFDAERELIEAQYHEAKDQVRQRLLASIEERRRKLREEKEGGDVVSESLLEHGQKPRAKRRMLFKNRIPRPAPDPFEMPLTADSTATSDALNADSQPVSASTNTSLVNGNGTVNVNGNGNDHGSANNNPSNPTANGITPPRTDILLHSLLAPSLSLIDISTILQPNSTSLVLLPPSVPHAAPTGKNARRGANATNAKNAAAAAAAGGGAGGDDLIPAPGTATALAIASGQQQPRRTNNAGASTGMVLGKSLHDLKKMELASQLDMDGDWARIQQGGTRGRRGRGD